ncbi:GNAT family N-acetyltransferase [Streptoalloteichus hindustanus]|uniref:Predicted N-acetyltransferase YhbS n=1 Tax=Streptoalloteichus hindustanus TaxID=2017 RepID=A0A1M5GNQ4_STRHI|nr:GNAT family N-acetyltransferase [Streptoalloteichus hindustanus]SHG05369.1 Predicted N-acetyltransferase YhbS [Streptoalloteichus hindustanus]
MPDAGQRLRRLGDGVDKVEEANPALTAGTIVVRAADPAEYADVGELTVAAFAADGQLVDDDRQDQELRDAAGRAARAELLVAVDGVSGALLGTVTLSAAGAEGTTISRDDEWEFRALAVLPAVQGRGVGRRLVRAVLDRARAARARRVVLLTRDVISAARQLYETMGFTRMPERDWEPVPGARLLAYGFELVREHPVRRARVRSAEPAEYHEIGELTVTAYRADGLLEGTASYAGVLRDAASRAAMADLLVAVDSTGVLGTVTVCRPGSPWVEVARGAEWEFRALAVHPRARGRGLGRLLVQAVLDRAARHGVRRVVLSSQHRMRSAQRLYEAMGFTRMPDRDRESIAGVRLLGYGREVEPLPMPATAGVVRVRPIADDDFAAVGDLMARVYVGEGYAGEAVVPLLSDTARRARQTELLVAVEGDAERERRLGSVTLCRADSPYAQLARHGELELRMLAVEPTARGRGVGEGLVRALLDHARGIGGRRVVLSAQPTMYAAQRLFTRTGFLRDRERDWHTSFGLHMLAYVHSLRR